MKRVKYWSIYGLLAVTTVLLSSWPPYHPLAANDALILVSFAHPSRPEGACRKRTEAELAGLPPNMRAPEVCPRRRIAVELAVEIDGNNILEKTLVPAGIEHDGSASIHRRITVPAGRHALRVRMLDQERAQNIVLVPGQVLRIDYRPEQGGVVIL